VAAAVTGCIVDYQVDSEIHDGVSYIGDEIRNVTGDGQSHAYSIAAGRTATHNARLYNEGNATQRLGLTDGGDDARWIVEYVDVATGQDITADLTGTGCFTPAMAPGQYRRIRLRATPGPGVAAGESLTLLIRGRSSLDMARIDVVKATTTLR